MTPTSSWDPTVLYELLDPTFKGGVQVDQVRQAPHGANAQQHLFLDLDDGSTVSLKRADRMAAHGGTENEFFAYQIANIVDAPHSCRAELVDLNHSGIPEDWQDDTVLMVEHMRGDVVELGDASTSVQDHPFRFLRDLGAWAIVTATIATQDRNKGNLLWDQEDHRLIHIDFEDSFRSLAGVGNMKDQLAPARYVSLDLKGWTNNPDDYFGSAVADGIRAQDPELKANKEEILRCIREAGADDSFCRKAEDWIQTSVDDKIRTARQTVA